MTVSGKSIIVTGGASGIGLGMVNHFASLSTTKSKHHITVLDVTTSSFPALRKTLETAYADAATFTFLTCDVSSWDSIAACFKQVYDEQGRIDIVMANAGISKEGRLIDTDPQAEPQKPGLGTIDVNLMGCIYTVKLAVHYMRRNTLPIPHPSTDATTNGTRTTGLRGQIICTASNAGIYLFPVAPVYAATKSAVAHLVRSLAPTLIHPAYAITLNALAPAVLQTNIAPDPALFRSMILTPMGTLCRGVDFLLGGDSNGEASKVNGEVRTGQVVEVHGENVTVREEYGWVDEDSRRNIEEFTRLGYA